MATSASNTEDLERILVSYIKDFNIVRNFYQNNPSKLNESIEHINRVLSLPCEEVKLIAIKLHLELRSNSLDPVDFPCSPSWTVLTTKYKICEKYQDYEVKNLFVLYRKSIAKDSMYLSDCGIEQNGDTLYVYICNPQSYVINQRQKRFREIAHVTQHVESPTAATVPTFPNIEFNQDFTSEPMSVAVKSPNLPEPVDSGSYGSLWTCTKCTFLNESWRKECVLCNSPFPGSGIEKGPPSTILPSVFQGIDFEPTIDGWKCPLCTFINEPTRPGCEICSGPRPADYNIPENHQLSEREMERISKETQAENEARQLHSLERQTNYNQHLSAAENTDIMHSNEPIECMICFTEVEPNDSIVLRECLHKFCKDCVIGHVKNSEEAIVTCPYMDDDYNCDNTITQREIKALLSEDDFKKYLHRGLMQAEKESPNSFHCKTPDCHGWCIYEDHVNAFECPVCKKVNCILCKAIHEGKNCKEYQDELMKNASTNQEAKKTKEALNKMLKSGDAMHCPKCNIIISKKVGCDWIRCSMCKVEICWVTKGPRWGPNGPGDTSGGCRCRIGGKACHVNCKNCH